jgi:hypothetical protein
LESATGRALILRQHLQDHHVLIGGGVNYRDLARAVGAEERVLHLIRRDAQRDGAVAVDIHHHLRAGNLHVAVEGRQMHRPGSAMPAQQTDHRLVAGPALTHSRQKLFN